MTRYIVRELIDGKWRTVRVYHKRTEAELLAKVLGERAKVVEFHIPIAPRQM